MTAMGPVGDIAGSASSLTRAARLAGGAVLGAQTEDRVTTFAVGLLIASGLACLSILAVQRSAER